MESCCCWEFNFKSETLQSAEIVSVGELFVSKAQYRRIDRLEKEIREIRERVVSLRVKKQEFRKVMLPSSSMPPRRCIGDK